MKITRNDVENVALLSRLEIPEEQVEKYTGHLNAFLEYADVLTHGTAVKAPQKTVTEIINGSERLLQLMRDHGGHLTHDTGALNRGDMLARRRDFLLVTLPLLH